MEQKENNLQGLWVGTITYGKSYKAFAGSELFFELELREEGNQISGEAMDTGGFGVSPDPAKIIGFTKEREIHFVKQYTTCHFLDVDKRVIIDPSTPGLPIRYSGLFDEMTQRFAGDWVMEAKTKFLWIFPVTHRAGGTWTMQRKGNDRPTMGE